MGDGYLYDSTTLLEHGAISVHMEVCHLGNDAQELHGEEVSFRLKRFRRLPFASGAF